MNWEKIGRIFLPEGQHDWVKTHAMLPTIDHVKDDLFRVYFSGRDDLNISRTGFIEFDINDPTRILKLSKEPVVDIGELGAYDDNGVSPTCIVNHDGKKFFYIMGWNKGSKVRAAEVSGLAISNDNGDSFQRYSRSPIIDRTNDEPFTILVVSCILIEDGIWRMWYDSADKWISEELPRYNIKYAESVDGIHWKREGLVSVDYKDENETRVSRASVIKDDGKYKMWYCYAMGTGGYTMGYAESADGYQFTRMDDKVGIHLSDEGWDSQMICYPNVFKHKEDIYMLYSGNGYGKEGFGLAKLRR
ncbi:hypothetical protein EV198_1294 [Roseivirga ehrenbergii]|nr:hypothetical protein [Roseivirga ehrenbergii]TCL14451.1 hypothetical protein EV198_1294 [Roseivirga ehrenbergii]